MCASAELTITDMLTIPVRDVITSICAIGGDIDLYVLAYSLKLDIPTSKIIISQLLDAGYLEIDGEESGKYDCLYYRATPKGTVFLNYPSTTN